MAVGYSDLQTLNTQTTIAQETTNEGILYKFDQTIANNGITGNIAYCWLRHAHSG